MDIANPTKEEIDAFCKEQVLSPCNPTPGFIHDRIMSLHRRAYDLIVSGKNIADWIGLARRLEFTDIGCIDQFWQTAQTAVNAGMTREFAFPLCGEINLNPS